MMRRTLVLNPSTRPLLMPCSMALRTMSRRFRMVLAVLTNGARRLRVVRSTGGCPVPTVVELRGGLLMEQHTSMRPLAPGPYGLLSVTAQT